MIGWFKRRKHPHVPTDRELVLAIILGVDAMALSFEKLNASVARSADVSDKVLAHLAASQPDPAVEVANQASIDNAASALDVQSTKAESVLPPAPAAEAPAA